MQLGKVVGTLVSSKKEPSLDGLRLMVVKHLDHEGRETGSHVIAADAVGAGPEELVLLASGSSARQTSMTDRKPVDAVIMAIVDSWTIDGEDQYRKGNTDDHSDYS
jgi:microcompartment protein CcmK/EutM